MNALLHALGIDGWRPVLTALALPPVPFLLLIFLGARLQLKRRLLGWILLLLGGLGVWMGCTSAFADGVRRWLLPPVRALAPSEIAELKRKPNTAIVVLGGGRLELAPEYGTADLSALGHERLRYGLWLSRETGLPVLFSGGLGHLEGAAGPSEAEIAARVAERDYARPLRWQESRSRDTRENALFSVPMLREQGITHIVLVTHAVHIPRARSHFERAMGDAAPLKITPAPVAVPRSTGARPIDYLPSRAGFTQSSLAVHEWLGRLTGF